MSGFTRYFKPKASKLTETFRTIIAEYDGRDFYTNGYYAVEYTALKVWFPSLYVRTLLNEPSSTKANLGAVIGDLDNYIAVGKLDHLVDLERNSIDLVNEIGMPMVSLSVEFVALFEAMSKRHPITYKVHRDCSEKPVLVLASTKVIGCIMPLRRD